MPPIDQTTQVPPERDNTTLYIICGSVGVLISLIIVGIIVMCVRKCRKRGARPAETGGISDYPDEPFYTADQFEFKGTLYVKKDWDIHKIGDDASIDADEASPNSRIKHTNGPGNVVFEIGSDVDVPNSQKTQVSTGNPSANNNDNMVDGKKNDQSVESKSGMKK